MLATFRLLWSATRGHRLRPWRSEFLRWRIETYSGKPADTLHAGDIWTFFWNTRWELLSFMVWANRLEKEARKRG